MAGRRLRKFLIVPGAALALVVLAVLLADSAWVKRRLLAAVDGKLRSELGLSLTAGGSTLRLTRLAASLRDVRLAPVAAGTGPLRVLTAAEIHVDLAWSTLFTGDLRIQEVRIVGPRLEAALPGRDAPLPSPAATPGRAPAKPFSFEISKFVLLDGAVSLGGSGRALSLSLDDIRFDLRLLGPGPDHRAELRSGGGRLALSGPPVEIRALEADLVLDERRIEVERVLLATPLSRLEVRGRVGDYQSTPVFDLEAAASLSLEEASGLIPSLPPAGGTLVADGTFRGTAGSMSASVDLRSDGLSVERFPRAVLRASAASDLRALELKELVFEASGARLEARGTVRPPGAGGSSLELSWAGLDLALLRSFVPGLPPLEAVSRGRVAASWNEFRVDSLRAAGEASFLPVPRPESGGDRPLSPPRPPLLPVEGDISFKASREGLEVARAGLRAAGGELSLSGRVGWDGGLRARFEASVPDLAAALRSAAPLTGPVEGLPTMGGRARLEGTVGGTTAAPSVRAALTAEGLTFDGRDAGALEAAVETDGKTFEASASSAGLDLASLAPFLPVASLSGRVAFEAEGRGSFERPSFSLRLEGRDVVASGFRVPSLLLTAESDGTSARARLTGGSPLEVPPPFVLEAEVPFADPAGSKFSLSLTSVDIGSLAALAGASLPAGAAGEADLSVRAAGDPRRPAALTVEGEVGRLVLAGVRPGLESRGPVRFSLRNGTFELEEFALGAGDSLLKVSGFVRDLAASPRIEARASVDLDASLIPPGLIDASVGGRLKLDAFADGPLRRPVVRGEGGLSDGFLRTRDFPLVLSDLSLRLELRGRTVLVTDGQGLANGGLLKFSGRVDLGEGAGAGRAALEADLEGFRLSYPPGLVTLSNGKARLEGDGRTWLLSGDLRVLQGSYREDVFPGAELLGFSSLPLLPEGETPPAAHNVRLNVTAATVEPIVVHNNMAEFALEANVRVTGTMAAPLLTGRVRSVAVGEIVFGERRYTLESLRLEFLGQPVPDPEIEITAHTRLLHRMEELEVRLRLSGPASDLKFSLTSTPPRSSQDLSLLLLTGRSLDEVRGSALDTLRDQMVLHFMSPLLSPVTRSLEKFLGLDDIRFMPMGIASEEDPGARLTFVKNLADRLALTYSIDVSQTERQSWFMDYGLSRKFVLQAYRKDDASYGGSFRHTVPLWEEREAGAGEREVLAAVEVEAEGEGGTRLDRRLLEKAWKPLRPGRPYRVSALGRATDNLNRLYRKNGYAGAAVTPVVTRSESGPPRVTVVFRIEPGDPAVFDFRGDRIPAGLRRKVLAAWTGKLPEAANLASARETILGELLRRRYYRAEVEAEALRDERAGAGAGGTTTYAIRVARNGRYRARGFEITGGGAVEASVVRKAASDFPLAASRGLWNAVHAPRLAARSVERAYRERGYARASVEVARLEEDREARAVDIVIAVEEGPRSVVRGVAIEGNSVLGERELRGALGLEAGKPYDPAAAAEGRTALLNLYRGKGYQDVEVAVAVAAEGADGTGGAAGGDGDVGVSVTYRVDEGPRHTIASVGVAGGGRTGERFVRGVSGLEPGQPLTSEALARGQKRIYDSGIFRSVDIDSGPEDEAEGGAKEGAEAERKDGGDGVRERIDIEVREMPPVTLAYGLRYNSEEKLEGFGEVDLRSPVGDGLAGVLAFRRNARQSDLRFSVESSYMFGARFNLLATVYTKRDVRELFTADESGLTLQSRFELPSKLDFSALYRMNRIHTYDPAVPEVSPVEENVFVSEIAGLLVRDTRDDLFDPKRGSFLSLAVTWSPEFLATEMPYVSVFGQVQSYRRFGPGLVWAAAARVGAADAFGCELVAAKRFFAGGGNSVRGFKQDGVGPVDPLLGVPAGGAVVAVVNQELRFPVLGPASGVLFYDLGAVYPTLRDVRLGEVRHGMGIGLRLKSPIGLVRADYGFNLWPREGEKRGVFYLSIGQAF